MRSLVVAVPEERLPFDFAVERQQGVLRCLRWTCQGEIHLDCVIVVVVDRGHALLRDVGGRQEGARRHVQLRRAIQPVAHRRRAEVQVGK